MISSHTSPVVSDGSTFTCVRDQERHWVQLWFPIEFNQQKHCLIVCPNVGLSILPALFLTVITGKWNLWKQGFMSILFLFEWGSLTFKPIWWLPPFTLHPVSPVLFIMITVHTDTSKFHTIWSQVFTITKGSGYGNPVSSPERRTTRMANETWGQHPISWTSNGWAVGQGRMYGILAHQRIRCFQMLNVILKSGS